jgi:hypothetical protein
MPTEVLREATMSTKPKPMGRASFETATKANDAVTEP